MKFASNKELEAKFGKPNITGSGYLVRVKLPYPMKLAWEPQTRVNYISCHKMIATSLLAALSEVLATYGMVRISALNLDVFGGCFNYRKKRNGTTLSSHSWGIAIDLDPANNQNSWRSDKAIFARSEYKQFIDIMYKHGFYSYGREIGRDYMHFEFE